MIQQRSDQSKTIIRCISVAALCLLMSGAEDTPPGIGLGEANISVKPNLEEGQPSTTTSSMSPKTTAYPGAKSAISASFGREAESRTKSSHSTPETQLLQGTEWSEFLPHSIVKEAAIKGSHTLLAARARQGWRLPPVKNARDMVLGDGPSAASPTAGYLVHMPPVPTHVGVLERTFQQIQEGASQGAGMAAKKVVRKRVPDPTQAAIGRRAVRRDISHRQHGEMIAGSERHDDFNDVFEEQYDEIVQGDTFKSLHAGGTHDSIKSHVRPRSRSPEVSPEKMAEVTAETGTRGIQAKKAMELKLQRAWRLLKQARALSKQLPGSSRQEARRSLAKARGQYTRLNGLQHTTLQQAAARPGVPEPRKPTAHLRWFRPILASKNVVPTQPQQKEHLGVQAHAPALPTLAESRLKEHKQSPQAAGYTTTGDIGGKLGKQLEKKPKVAIDRVRNAIAVWQKHLQQKLRRLQGKAKPKASSSTVVPQKKIAYQAAEHQEEALDAAAQARAKQHVTSERGQAEPAVDAVGESFDDWAHRFMRKIHGADQEIASAHDELRGDVQGYTASESRAARAVGDAQQRYGKALRRQVAVDSAAAPPAAPPAKTLGSNVFAVPLKSVAKKPSSKTTNQPAAAPRSQDGSPSWDSPIIKDPSALEEATEDVNQAKSPKTANQAAGSKDSELSWDSPIIKDPSALEEATEDVNQAKSPKTANQAADSKDSELSWDSPIIKDPSALEEMTHGMSQAKKIKAWNMYEEAKDGVSQTKSSSTTNQAADSKDSEAATIVKDPSALEEITHGMSQAKKIEAWNMYVQAHLSTIYGSLKEDPSESDNLLEAHAETKPLEGVVAKSVKQIQLDPETADENLNVQSLSTVLHSGQRLLQKGVEDRDDDTLLVQEIPEETEETAANSGMQGRDETITPQELYADAALWNPRA